MYVKLVRTLFMHQRIYLWSIVKRNRLNFARSSAHINFYSIIVSLMILASTQICESKEATPADQKVKQDTSTKDLESKVNAGMNVLIREFTDPNEAIKLLREGNVSAKFIEENFTKQNAHGKFKILQALEYLPKDPAYIAILRTSLRNESPRIRSFAACKLSTKKQKEDLKRIAPLLEDASAIVQVCAAGALTLIDRTFAKQKISALGPLLEKHLGISELEYVRRSAFNALMLLGTRNQKK